MEIYILPTLRKSLQFIDYNTRTEKKRLVKTEVANQRKKRETERKRKRKKEFYSNRPTSGNR